ncbi:transcription elongation factor SPT5-like [Watersipora subatra]|uniref:transcription elongation factor SPT5-like n=1 Tax=Watersipora subatra TaxID=2589382 RepID=UPI00355B7931
MSDSEEDLVSEEEEEEEESDIDDEEEDEEEVGPRKKRSRVEGFILDEAEVGENDDESEGEWEDGAQDLIDKDTEIENSARDLESRRRLDEFMNKNEDELEEFYRRRWTDTDVQNRFGDGENMSDEITQQGLLPDVNRDPNLWVVRCRMGEERDTVLALMRKFVAYQDTDDPIKIKSVTYKDGLKGVLYIEAFKQTHVKHAIDGVSSLRMGTYKQQMVPIKEMTDVMRVVKEKMRLKEGTWVRMKRGLYKDDLAQVDYVDPSEHKIRLKLIPRIDYSRMRGVMRSQNAQQQLKKRRPPAKVFNEEDIRAIGGEVSTQGSFKIFESNEYNARGFLIKTFYPSAFISEGVKPSLAELSKFEDKPESVSLDSLISKSGSGTEVAHNFAAGDMVEVAEGELVHLQGKIISIDGNKITMLPKHDDLKDPLEFPAHELKKFFKTGDHVKVLGGRYESDTGLIVRVEDNLIVLFSDITMHELKVLPSDLQLCPDMATGVDSMGQYQFGDLVQLDGQRVGVIVRLERESFQVLTNENKLIQVKHQAINKKKDSRHAVALDAENNNLQVKDIVKVVDGSHAGLQGEIRHLYRNFAFLHSRMMMENGGIFVCKTRQLQLAGGARQTSVGGLGYMSPRISSPAHPGSGSATPTGEGRGRGRGRGAKRDTSLIGQTVKIVGGPFKGHIGIVKDCTEDTARVELHTNCKTISVDKNRLSSLKGGRLGSSSTRSDGGRTPMHAGSGTPMHGSQTPMYGSKTPMYGSQTPLYDGSRTPHYGSHTPLHEGAGSSRTTPGSSSVWDPNSGNTPARNSDYDYNQPTPGSPAAPNYASTYSPYQAASPGGYNAPSPGFGGTSMVGTPSPMSAYSPMTPGTAPYTPATPGLGLEHGGVEWVSADLMVKISAHYKDSTLADKQGQIKNISNNVCNVYVEDVDRVISITSDNLEPITPEKSDKVKVIVGEKRDTVGTLISIDGVDGVLKTDQGDINILQIRTLCKMAG